MKHLAFVIDGRTGSAPPMGMASISAFNDRLGAAGHRVFAGGPESPSGATVTGNQGGEAAFTDRPFLESKECCSGVSTIEALDIDVVLGRFRPPTTYSPPPQFQRTDGNGRSRDISAALGNDRSWPRTTRPLLLNHLVRAQQQ